MNAILQHPARQDMVNVKERAVREAVEQLQTAAEKFSQIDTVLHFALQLAEQQGKQNQLYDLILTARETSSLWSNHLDEMASEARSDLMPS